MYICHIYSSCFLRSKEKSMYFNLIPVCGGYIWEISQSAPISVKILVTGHWQICRLQLKFQFLPQLSIKSIFSNMVHAGYLGNVAFGPCFVQQFTVSCVAKQKFLLFLLLFGTLAIKAMAFWEISIFSQQIYHFLKVPKGLGKFYKTSPLFTLKQM